MGIEDVDVCKMIRNSRYMIQFVGLASLFAYYSF